MNERARQTNQQVEISDVSLSRSPSRFVSVLRLPRLSNTRFHGAGLHDGRTWREGILSLKHRRCNETNQNHPTQQSPYENDRLPGNENVHRRPPGTKSSSRLQHYSHYTAGHGSSAAVAFVAFNTSLDARERGHSCLGLAFGLASLFYRGRFNTADWTNLTKIGHAP